jgi:hypothetical protein
VNARTCDTAVSEAFEVEAGVAASAARCPSIAMGAATAAATATVAAMTDRHSPWTVGVARIIGQPCCQTRM